MIRRIQITHTPVFISFSSSSSSSVVKIIQRKRRTLLIIHREFLTNCKKERGREREREGKTQPATNEHIIERFQFVVHLISIFDAVPNALH